MTNSEKHECAECIKTRAELAEAVGHLKQIDTVVTNIVRGYTTGEFTIKDMADSDSLKKLRTFLASLEVE